MHDRSGLEEALLDDRRAVNEVLALIRDGLDPAAAVDAVRFSLEDPDLDHVDEEPDGGRR